MLSRSRVRLRFVIAHLQLPLSATQLATTDKPNQAIAATLIQFVYPNGAGGKGSGAGCVVRIKVLHQHL